MSLEVNELNIKYYVFILVPFSQDLSFCLISIRSFTVTTGNGKIEF